MEEQNKQSEQETSGAEPKEQGTPIRSSIIFFLVFSFSFTTLVVVNYYPDVVHYIYKFNCKYKIYHISSLKKHDNTS